MAIKGTPVMVLLPLPLLFDDALEEFLDTVFAVGTLVAVGAVVIIFFFFLVILFIPSSRRSPPTCCTLRVFFSAS